MRERPIIFSSEMVRAIIEGRKTQTRRIATLTSSLGFPREANSQWGIYLDRPHAGPYLHLGPCPYGTPGDHLWVRENFFVSHDDFDKGGKLPSERPEWADEMLHFCADGTCCDQIPECCCCEVGKPKNRPSIHMPRWASRLTLEVTHIKIERLNQISSNDARAEGIDTEDGLDPARTTHRDKWITRYHVLWDKLNGPGAWDKNPWVWVVSFRKLAVAHA